MIKIIESKKFGEYGKKWELTAPTENLLNDFASYIQNIGGRFDTVTLNAYMKDGYGIREVK